MLKPAVMLAIAGAVLATAGTAHAQTASVAAPGVSTAAGGEVPWYQRFTTSRGVTESITGAHENDRLAPQAWTLSRHWGVTVDVREATRIERTPQRRGDETSVGAFYQFTPAVRVGGQVSVETARGSALASPARRAEDDEPAANVRLESAFRF